jgi:hypothetical protein
VATDIAPKRPPYLRPSALEMCPFYSPRWILDSSGACYLSRFQPLVGGWVNYLYAESSWRQPKDFIQICENQPHNKNKSRYTHLRQHTFDNTPHRLVLPRLPLFWAGCGFTLASLSHTCVCALTFGECISSLHRSIPLSIDTDR